MPRKSLFIWIIAIGLIQNFLVFTFVLWEGEFSLWISLLLMVPVVAVAFVWRLLPKESWILSLFITLIIMVVFLSASFIISGYIYQAPLPFWEDIAFGSLYGFFWFLFLMLPTGFVYAAISESFNRRNKATIARETSLPHDL